MEEIPKKSPKIRHYMNPINCDNICDEIKVDYVTSDENDVNCKECLRILKECK